MLKFTMDSKELKSMIDKGVSVINKKSSCSMFKKLYFQITEDRILKIFGTDGEHYLEIVSGSAKNISFGIVGIDVDDLKLISKMNNDITLTDVSTENEKKINICCGKKNISIIKYDNMDISLPDMDNTEIKVMSLTESWLLETITNLSVFTLNDDARKELQTINFNTKDRRAETSDGFSIGIRELKENQIVSTEQNVILHKKCLPIFKKILDKKSDNEVVMSQDSKYIKICGENFTYVIRKIAREFFNTNSVLTDDNTYSFVADKENILEIMEYDFKLSKDTNEPVIFHYESGEMYIYIKTEKHEILDRADAENIIMDDMYIGFNPRYIMDAMKIVDKDKPLFRGKSNKSPLFIDGNEYKFLILPVYIGNNIKDIEAMEKYIDRIKAA